MRDNHFVACSDENRANSVSFRQLPSDTRRQQWIDVRLNWLDQIDKDQIFTIIDQELPASMRLDYLKMQNDVYIPKSRREEIVEKIQEILESYGYYEERQDL